MAEIRDFLSYRVQDWLMSKEEAATALELGLDMPLKHRPFVPLLSQVAHLSPLGRAAKGK